MKSLIQKLFALSFVALLTVACGQKEEAASTESAAPAEAAAPAPAAEPAQEEPGGWVPPPEEAAPAAAAPAEAAPAEAPAEEAK